HRRHVRVVRVAGHRRAGAVDGSVPAARCLRRSANCSCLIRSGGATVLLMRAVLVIALLRSSSIAAAQPARRRVEWPPPSMRDADGDVSPTTATILSAGGAALGIATIWMGSKMHDGDTPIMEMGAAIALVAPSSGQWYSRGSAYFTPGLGIR